MNEGDIDICDVDKFYDGVRRFYIVVFIYCIKWLLFDNFLFKNCVFIDFNERNKCSMDNVKGVLFFFGYIYRDVINNFIVMDMLEEEFFVY